MTGNDWLSIICSIYGLLGTVISVLSIIKMAIKDVLKTNTIGYLKDLPMPTLDQVYQARHGISLMTVGFLLEMINIFFKNLTTKQFIYIFAFSLIIEIIIAIYLVIRYKKQKKEIMRD